MTSFPPTPSNPLQQALALHQAGRLAEAERIYNSLLTARPDHPDLLRFLGLLHHQTGRQASAEGYLRRSIAGNPRNASAHSNLGEALRAQGRVEESLGCYRKALELDPAMPEAHNNLGSALAQLGRHEEAVVSFAAAFTRRPDYARARVNHLLALHQLGKLQELIPAARALLGMNLPGQKFTPAMQHQTQTHLASALLHVGDLAGAISAYQAALGLNANDADTHLAMGLALHTAARTPEALTHLQQAVRLKPSDTTPLLHLADVQRKAGMGAAALASLQRALQINPNLADAHASLGVLHSTLADYAAARAAFGRAIELNPQHPTAHGNLCLLLCGDPSASAEDVFEAHKAAGRALEVQYAQPLVPAFSGAFSGTVIRLGFVSPDFRHHPVATFLLPLLKHLDRSRFHVTLFSDTPKHDANTATLKALADGWVDLAQLPSDRAAKLILEQKPDVLIDLAGYTQHNRLAVFARRVAPVQMTYLGYPNTTGLSRMDARLTDELSDPSPPLSAPPLSSADSLHTEKLIRLPDGFLCWNPSEAGLPEVPPAASPSAAHQQVTFGSFNKFSKISPVTIGLWARVLEAVPQSKLVIKSPGLSDAEAVARARQYISSQAQAAGVPMDMERLVLMGPTQSYADHLAAYSQIDIALDTTPYAGTTTTCEALWMGVPVITLAGQTHAARVGVSILTHANLSQWIAADADAYVRLAADLAGDSTARAAFRTNARQHLLASTLCDAGRMAREFAAAVEMLVGKV